MCVSASGVTKRSPFLCCQVATAEVAALRADLRDAEKDRMSLANAKARLQVRDCAMRCDGVLY